MLWILLLAPLFPAAGHLFLPLISLDKEWRVLATSLVTLVVTGLVYNLNSPITRLYEGYPWKDSSIGLWRARRHRRRMVAAKKLRARLRYLCDHLEGVDPNSASLKAGRARQTRLARIVNNEFPDSADLVLPTRLGNVIRNFEQYPVVQYGISAIAFWPRLIAKIDERYAQGLDGAKASFDFMINASALSAASTVGILFLGVLSSPPLGLNAATLGWLARLAFFALTAWLTYQGALVQARNWGAEVRGAFDLYRLDLLKQIGYQGLPHNREEEKAVWKAITQKTVFPDMPREPQPSYSAQPTRAFAESPDWMPLRALRSISAESPNTLAVQLTVRNLDRHRTATNVLVLDSVAPDAEFISDSLACTAQEGELLGTRPVSYRLPSLAPQTSCTITYKLLQAVPH